MLFEKYSEDDYEAVCDFLIELNRADRSHINWNWARFEWMYEHPEFDKGSISSIGLWRDDKKVVGAAIYDMYFGEGFCGVLPGYKSIYPEALKYAYGVLRDKDGFSLAVCDDNPDEIKELQKQGFSAIDQSESIMELELPGEFMTKLPEGLSYYSPDPVKDAYKLEWLFWQGFDHGEDKKQFEKQEQIIPRVRKHYIRDLGVAAINGEGELVSFCGSWYSIRLLGHGKGGYSYLAERNGKQYVLKQIHHEPCAYYNFGNKIEAEQHDYERLRNAGIRIPKMIAIDLYAERILKEYIGGDTVFTMLREGVPVEDYLPQVRRMATQAQDHGLNIDYFPTNFVVRDGLIWYVDYECNDYMDEWNFENWGVRYWSRTPEFESYLKEQEKE